VCLGFTRVLWLFSFYEENSSSDSMSSLHTKHNFKKNETSIAPPNPKKKSEAPSFHVVTSHSLHGNSIPKVGCHYFLPLPQHLLPLTFFTKSSLARIIQSCIFIIVNWLIFTSHEMVPKFRSPYGYTQTGDETATTRYRLKLGPKDRVTLQIITVH
jgi:hypothetical protein